MPESAEPLVGIVVVSHSAQIAAGVVEVAREMCGDRDVRLIAAGGTADGLLGTDAVLIAEAVAQADTGAGVVILADLGSAVLSAKLALTMIDEELAARTRLSGGPLVEGAFVAAIQASAGDSLADVLRAAREAATMQKDADEERVGGDGAAAEPSAEATRPASSIEITVRNPAGLHGRPGAALVRAAAGFRSQIMIENLSLGSKPLDAKSHTNVLASGVRHGHVIRIGASGGDENAAIDAIRTLAAGGFGEGAALAGEISEAGHAAAIGPAVEPERTSTPAPTPTGIDRIPLDAEPAFPANVIADGRIAGKPGAAGIATGPVWAYREARAGADGTTAGSGRQALVSRCATS